MHNVALCRISITERILPHGRHNHMTKSQGFPFVRAQSPFRVWLSAAVLYGDTIRGSCGGRLSSQNFTDPLHNHMDRVCPTL